MQNEVRQLAKIYRISSPHHHCRRCSCDVSWLGSILQPVYVLGMCILYCKIASWCILVPPCTYEWELAVPWFRSTLLRERKIDRILVHGGKVKNCDKCSFSTEWTLLIGENEPGWWQSDQDVADITIQVSPAIDSNNFTHRLLYQLLSVQWLSVTEKSLFRIRQWYPCLYVETKRFMGGNHRGLSQIW